MSDSQSSTSGGPHLFHHSSEGGHHAPITSTSHGGETETNPTVSATGMPRFIPRHADERSSDAQDEKDAEQGSTPSELGSSHPENSDEEPDEQETGVANTSDPHYSSSGSLTLAALSPFSSLTIQRRLALLTSSLLINLGLPFINGVMLGFGEIFARVILAPALGITGIGWNGSTDRARVSNPFPRRQTGKFDSMTAGGSRNKTSESRWGSWGQGSSGTIDQMDEEIKERREQRGEEMYL